MLVVGTSLARAFGIVGAAGLVRYRAKIDDPKDAGVMLSTLAIGLACGVGLWVIAIFSTAFILMVLWVIESFEPKATQLLTLTVKVKDAPALKPQVEKLLARRGHDVGKIDGFLGAKSRAAVKSEQIKLGLPADSYPTPELVQRLSGR